MRMPLTSLAASLCALLLLAAPAAASPEPDTSPVRLWSVSKVEQGAGEVPVSDGAQVGGKLQETVDLGRVVFNLPLHAPYWYFLPRDRAFGSLFSSADGAQYSVLAQAPPPNPLRRGRAEGHGHAPGRVPGLREAGGRRLAADHALGPAAADDRRQQPASAAWECPPTGDCDPVRTVVRFHARAYAASAGGDFFNAGGVAYLEGHQHSWRPGAATSADSPGPLWGEEHFDVDGDADDSGTGAAGRDVPEQAAQREGPARLRPPPASCSPCTSAWRPRRSTIAAASPPRRRSSRTRSSAEPVLLTAHGLSRAASRASRSRRRAARAGALPAGAAARRGRAAAQRPRLHGRRVASCADGPRHPHAAARTAAPA